MASPRFGNEAVQLFDIISTKIQGLEGMGMSHVFSFLAVMSMPVMLASVKITILL